MGLRNSADSFGAVTRLVHWAMALGILGMLPFGLYIARMEVTAASFPLFGYHKAIGILLLTLGALRLAWHRASHPPGPISGGTPAWQLNLARATHIGLYVLMVAVPVTGLVASVATGLPIRPFGLFTVPQFLTPSEPLAEAGFRLHGALAMVLAGLIALHVAGALKRHLVDRDRTLLRMLRGQ